MVDLGLNLSLGCYGILKKMKRPKLKREASFGRFLTKIFLTKIFNSVSILL